jgi:23S rRNA pseudouridine1911/1915/1917 synthase
MDRIQENFILENPNSERIDALLAKRFTSYSRTYFQELIEAQAVLVNGLPLKKRQIPLSGDKICVTFKKRPGPDLAPQAIPLSILYEVLKNISIIENITIAEQ